MAQTYKSYKAPGLAPPIFHEVSATVNPVAQKKYIIKGLA